MTSFMSCVGWPAIIVGGIYLFCIMFHATATAAEPTAYHRAPILTHVFSADYCAPCQKLKATLASRKTRVRPTLVYEQPEVSAFPSCAYNYEGRIVWDNGERIYSGDYRLPEQPVEIIEYISKGRK